MFAVIRKCEVFVDRFRRCVRPTRERRWSVDDIIIFAHRGAKTFSVHLACGRHQGSTAAACSESQQRARLFDVRLNGVNRSLDNEPNPHCSGKVIDHIEVTWIKCWQLLRNIALDQSKPRAPFLMREDRSEIRASTRREIIDDGDFSARRKHVFSKV